MQSSCLRKAVTGRPLMVQQVVSLCTTTEAHQPVKPKALWRGRHPAAELGRDVADWRCHGGVACACGSCKHTACRCWRLIEALRMCCLSPDPASCSVKGTETQAAVFVAGGCRLGHCASAYFCLPVLTPKFAVSKELQHRLSRMLQEAGVLPVLCGQARPCCSGLCAARCALTHPQNLWVRTAHQVRAAHL